MRWREFALCRGLAHTGWWFSNNERAKQICQECPVRAACLHEGYALRDRGVVRGGKWFD